MNTELEIWKDIENNPNYMVSNLGRVKSLKYGKERIMKQGINNKGYYYVNLCKEGKIKKFSIHRLVASAFIPNLNNYPCVNHKDENPQNNSMSNLEWCTYQYNLNYGLRNEKASKTLSIVKKGVKLSQEHKNNISKALSISIVQLTKNGEFIKQWNSTHQVERELNIFQTSITKCCKGKLKTYKGYKWMYAKDYYHLRTLNRMKDIFTKLNELKQVS